MRFPLLWLAAVFLAAAVPRGLAEKPGTLRVLTFNIRCAVQSDKLDFWPNRCDAAAKLMADESDLAGLQEVRPEQREDLRARLPQFGCVGVGREPNDLGESSCIFYRRDRFRVLDSGTFWLSETPETPGSKNWAVLPRICTWARLRDDRAQSAFYFFNTHLDHKAQEARLKSLPLIWQRMTAIRGGAAVLFTGDFNMPADNPAFAALPLTSTYQVLGQAPAGTFHGFTGEPKGGAIDFIFLEPERWVVSRTSRLETTYPGVDGRARYVSDHFPVVAEVELKTEIRTP